MKNSKRLREATVSAVCALLVAQDGGAEEASSLAGMITQGAPLLDIRYRLENVEQDNELKDATASTLRTRLGFETAEYHGLAALVEGENIVSVGDDDYNSSTNNNAEYSVVLDPETTEFNRAYVSYRLRDTLVKVGRQRMKWDNDRFLGNVGFRQNEQTYDAITLMNTSFDGSRFIYAYMTEAQRFLGDDNSLGDLDMNSHFINYSYQQLNTNRLTVYAYFLEMKVEELLGRSTKTFGLRYKGDLDMASTKLLYTLEYANQSDYAKGASTNDADYALLELGVKFSNEWIAKLGVEMLGGDGIYGFQTPLATAHAHNGWADIFAAGTPTDGLVDTYANISAPILGVKTTITYHNFASDNDSSDYGTEVDLEVSKKFGEHYEVGLKYASYSADDLAVDTDKIWGWFAVSW
ncbi:MAG: alginate export family protein [Pseudomonadales bacterium]